VFIEKYLLRSITFFALICLAIVFYSFYYTSNTMGISLVKLIFTSGFPISIFPLICIILFSSLSYVWILSFVVFFQLAWSAIFYWPWWEGLWVIKAIPNLFHANNLETFLVGLESWCILLIWILTLTIILMRIILHLKNKK